MAPKLDLAGFTSTVKLTDGAWGRQLQQHGLPPGYAPELWNIEKPDAVLAVAGSYILAGSDVILSNTFGANRLVLARHEAGNRTAELAAAGVRISRKAAGSNGHVFASLGPSGQVVMLNDVPVEQIYDAFAESAQSLAVGGADAIVLETFNELAELEIALKAARSACKLPIVACMSFASGADKAHTTMGDTPADLARVAAECGADAVGANCGAGPVDYVKVTALLRAATDLPIWVKPNAGLPVLNKDGRTTFPMGPEEFASHVQALIDAGGNFIGGCCGTTPEHIQALRQLIPRPR